MGFRPPSDGDTAEFKKRVAEALEDIEIFHSIRLNIDEVECGDHQTTDGTPAMMKKRIEIEFVAFTKEYPNPKLQEAPDGS